MQEESDDCIVLSSDESEVDNSQVRRDLDGGGTSLNQSKPPPPPPVPAILVRFICLAEFLQV